jgi:transcriptional regulator with XRE-family HTH domain
MDQFTPGERVKFFREHFGLSQREFGKAFDMSRGNISKIESGEIGLSNACLFGMMYSYGANPHWIKTGEGEMFITAKDYVMNGIKVIGIKQFGKGLVEIFKDPQFSELHSYIAIDNTIKENLSDDLAETLQQVSKLWQHGDERTRRTLVQLVKALPEVGE